MSVKKIFSTAIAPSTPANVAPAMIVVNISSITNVPRFAGSTQFNATAAA